MGGKYDIVTLGPSVPYEGSLWKVGLTILAIGSIALLVWLITSVSGRVGAFGLVAAAVGGLSLLYGLADKYDFQQADRERRLIAAFHEAGYSEIRTQTDENTFVGRDRDGDPTFGCYKDIRHGQYIVVPGGPDDDDRCTVPLATPSTND